MIDPQVALGVRPFQVASPLDALQRQVSIQDMLSQLSERKQMAKFRNVEAENMQANMEAQARARADQDFLQKALTKNAVLKDNAPVFDENGNLTYDEAGLARDLTQAGKPHLLLEYRKNKATLAKAQADQYKAELDVHDKELQRVGDTLSAFEPIAKANPDSAADLWPAFIQSKVKSGQLSPQAGAQYAQQAYTPEWLSGEIDSALGAKEALARHKAQADEARTTAEEERKKSEDQRKETDSMVKSETETEAEGRWKQAHPDTPMPDWIRQSVRARVAREVEQKKTSKQKDQERVERGYAMAIGKKYEDLTAEDRVKADAWYTKKTPDKQTEFDKRLSLFRDDPETYAALYGHGAEDKPLTQAQKASILNNINTAVARHPEFTPEEATQYKKDRLDELKEAGIDLSGAKPAVKPQSKTTPPATPMSAHKRAGWIVDPAGKEHYVTDIDAAIALHKGTHEK